MDKKGNIRNTCLRFNIDKPIHSKAWEYLQSMDKSEFKSYTQAIAIAVSDYFDRYNCNQSDPYFESREREERFIEQIIGEVEKSLANIVPQFLTACLAGIAKGNSNAVTEMPVEIINDSENNEIDYDFVGG